MANIPGMLIEDGSVGSGTVDEHDLEGAALDGVFGGVRANHLVVTNRHASQTINLTFSQDGSTYTGDAYKIPGGATVEFRDLNVMKVKVDGSGASTVYSLAAWQRR